MIFCTTLLYVCISCYGVATNSRLLEIIGLFCKRALYKRLYSVRHSYMYVCMYVCVCARLPDIMCGTSAVLLCLYSNIHVSHGSLKL